MIAAVVLCSGIWQNSFICFRKLNVDEYKSDLFSNRYMCVYIDNVPNLIFTAFLSLFTFAYKRYSLLFSDFTAEV